MTQAEEMEREAVRHRIAELEAQNAALMAERDALKAAKWDVKHVDTMNDMVQMGMARDAAIADAATAFNRGLEEAAKIARQYREEAGGSESYRSACQHIAEAITRALKSDSKEAG